MIFAFFTDRRSVEVAHAPSYEACTGRNAFFADRRSVGIALLTCCLLTSGHLPAARGQSERNELPAKRARSLTPQRKAEVLEFVKRHQPELLELLIYLKENRKREFERALRELDRVAQRLSQTRRRQPRRYALELEAWKAQSKIQLLVARIVMHNDPQDREALKAAVAQQHRIRRELLEQERRRLAERLERLDATLQTLRDRQENFVERSVEQLLRKAKRRHEGRRREGRPRPRKNETPASRSSGAERKQRREQNKPQDKR